MIREHQIEGGPVGRSAKYDRLLSSLRMVAHNGVVALGTDEALLVSVMCAEMTVRLHALGKLDTFPNRIHIQYAIEVDPLSAVLRPHLPARAFCHVRRD